MLVSKLFLRGDLDVDIEAEEVVEEERAALVGVDVTAVKAAGLGSKRGTLSFALEGTIIGTVDPLGVVSSRAVSVEGGGAGFANASIIAMLSAVITEGVWRLIFFAAPTALARRLFVAVPLSRLFRKARYTGSKKGTTWRRNAAEKARCWSSSVWTVSCDTEDRNSMGEASLKVHGESRLRK